MAFLVARDYQVRLEPHWDLVMEVLALSMVALVLSTEVLDLSMVALVLSTEVLDLFMEVPVLFMEVQALFMEVPVPFMEVLFTEGHCMAQVCVGDLAMKG